MIAYPFDTLRDTFLRLMAEGMNYDEALSQFDEEEFTRAAMAEMEGGFTRTLSVFDGIEKAGNVVTNDERALPSLFDLKVHANFERANGINGEACQQALELWQAGWTSECDKAASDNFWAQNKSCHGTGEHHLSDRANRGASISARIRRSTR